MDIEFVDAKFHYVNIDELECGDVFVFKDHELKDPCVYFDRWWPGVRMWQDGYIEPVIGQRDPKQKREIKK
jgi:hypothetical protein